MFTVELSYPPSVNHQFSIIRGRPVLSKEARAYRQVVRRLLRAVPAIPVFGQLAVRLDLFPPDNRRRDCDNAQKSILDALQQGGAFIDDSQVVWLLTVKAEPTADARAVVTIGSMADGPLPSDFTPPFSQEGTL